MLVRLVRQLAGQLAEARSAAPSGRDVQPDTPFVAFLVPSQEVQEVGPGELLFAELASIRLRVLIPAAELARRIPVRLVPIARFLADPSMRGLGIPRAIVVAKLASATVVSMQAELSAALDAIADGRCAAPVFADLSDDYAALSNVLRAPFLAQYQRRLGELCTLVVPCAAQADAVAPLARHGVEVVEDPYETTAPQPIRTRAEGTLKLCWFGHLGAPNAAGLARTLSDLVRAAGTPAGRIELVAAERSRPLGMQIAGAVRTAQPGWTAEYTAWSLTAAEEAIERSDFVVLPQEHDTPWGLVKSHNRLVHSVRCGRLALASPIRSYLELSQFAWIGEPLADGLKWALRHPEDAANRVLAGQSYVAQRFSPAAIGARWARVLGL